MRTLGFLPRKGSPVVPVQSNWDHSSTAFKIYPNPIKDHLQVLFKYLLTRKVELILVDAFRQNGNIMR